MDSEAKMPVAVKRPTLTPKALIHQKFGTKASYRIEEVHEPAGDICPGLTIKQRVPCVFKCHLELPGLTVVSDTFPRKKDAEQSAAGIAVEKLGIQSAPSDPTPQEIWTELVGRLSYIFSEEFLSSSHPLIGHFRQAFERDDNYYGFIPLSVIMSCDLKTSNLCKSVNPKAETNSLLMAQIIMKAANLQLIDIPDGELWIGKKSPYSKEVIQSVIDQHPGSEEPVQLEVVRIPSSAEKPIETLTIDIAHGHYYLDEIASKLNVKDSSRVLISRSIGKASNEMRLYFQAPEFASLSLDSSLRMHSNENEEDKQILNERASYLSCQLIHGDAILAAVGYTRKAPGLFHEHVSLSTYYRMIISKVPVGIYKLSRDAIFLADFPSVYTTHSNWRGPSPKELICMFCRHHRLPEPLFNVESVPLIGASLETSKSSKKRSIEGHGIPSANGEIQKENEPKSDNTSYFKCEMKILSRNQDLIIQYSHVNTYRKQSDAIQNASFKVFSLLDRYFKEPVMPLDNLAAIGQSHGILVKPEIFLEEFVFPAYYANENILCRYQSSVESIPSNQSDKEHENKINLMDADYSGTYPSQGSFVCISYTMSLQCKEFCMIQILESKAEFEFEIGVGAVIHELEAHVLQMSIDQNVKFILKVPSRNLMLAGAGETAKLLSKIDLHDCTLECSVKLLWIQEPLEDRIERALFKPPLSKQRVEFAVRLINESCAKTLVDFGCGSGSLLDSLLDHRTTLEMLVGVDISQKALTRAARILHSKLNSFTTSNEGACIKSALLYDGSITVFDSRIRSFDVGTCLEVIEHMEEEQAYLFGEIVLSLFCPRLLIVSTPNYEYNPILKGSPLSNKEEEEEKDAKEKIHDAPCNFRNHDHKFEWTREQFQCWATNLASRHNYGVSFSGVGGSGDVEPGFASQIAVFKRNPDFHEDESGTRVDSSHPYNVIWEWKNVPTP